MIEDHGARTVSGFGYFMNRLSRTSDKSINFEVKGLVASRTSLVHTFTSRIPASFKRSR